MRRIRLLVAFAIAGLVVSGLTAFPLLRDSAALARSTRTLGLPDFVNTWTAHVHDGLAQTYAAHPYIAYGTDWLAFGHLVIALFMIGAFIDPVRNVWLLRAGMIACLLVVPTALVCGAIRGIPLWWRLVDCSFGVVGFIPLAIAARMIRRLPPASDLSSARD
ncbi:MAG: hypothetical protein ACR2NX_16655 [Chthoniobacterales bacterium]